MNSECLNTLDCVLNFIEMASVNDGLFLLNTVIYCFISTAFVAFSACCLQCFDTVGWAAGRASSL